MKNTTSFENHAALGYVIVNKLSLDVEFIKRRSKDNKHNIMKQCAFVHVNLKNIIMDAAANASPH